MSERLVMYDARAALLGWAITTSNDAVMGWLTIVTPTGSGDDPATTIRASLANADVTGRASALSATLSATTDHA